MFSHYIRWRFKKSECLKNRRVVLPVYNTFWMSTTHENTCAQQWNVHINAVTMMMIIKVILSTLSTNLIFKLSTVIHQLLNKINHKVAHSKTVAIRKWSSPVWLPLIWTKTSRTRVLGRLNCWSVQFWAPLWRHNAFKWTTALNQPPTCHSEHVGAYLYLTWLDTIKIKFCI